MKHHKQKKFPVAKQQNVQRTFTVRKTYVKRTLNAWIKHHTFNVCFYHTLYMRFEKSAFNACYEKHAIYHPLKSIMLSYYIPCIKIVFSKHVKRMFW